MIIRINTRFLYSISSSLNFFRSSIRTNCVEFLPRICQEIPIRIRERPTWPFYDELLRVTAISLKNSSPRADEKGIGGSVKRTRTRESDEQGCPVEFMYRQRGRELPSGRWNCPHCPRNGRSSPFPDVRSSSPFDDVFERSSHALLSIPPPSFSLAENTNRGEAPINFQLYTHHDRNSTLLFPLVTRRCTWRTIGFLHHRKGEGGERENPSIHGARRDGSRLPSPTSYRSLLYFVMPPCHPSIYRDAGIVA